MKFIELDPRLIEPCPWNTNVVSHENEEKLRASIERHGMFKPVIVRQLDTQFAGGAEVYECIGGWHRCEQAIELGYQKIPVCDLGIIDDARAKEISLADNARYGLDDTLKLSGLLEELDVKSVEAFMPWTNRDIEAMTASIAVNIDDLDMSDVNLNFDEEDEEKEKPAPKAPKTHQLMKFRVPIADAAKISKIINETMQEEGFTAADDMTNAGEALAFIILQSDDDAVS